jgi:hypothetical protein
MFNLAVKSKVIGARPDAETLPDVFLNVLEETLTVGDLIARTVEEQVRDLTLTRRLDAERARDILNRQYMTAADIREQAAHGAVKMPVHPDARQIDVDEAVRKAKAAFERGVVLIVVDGVQAESLDQPFHLHATSRANFVRLTPLVGG